VRPTAEIGVRVDPGIRSEDRLIIVGNHDCIARGFEEAHCLLFPMAAKKGDPQKSRFVVRETAFMKDQSSIVQN
jgi:hypothetical protein